MKKKSWKTTIAGLLAAVGAALSQSDDATLKSIGGVLAPIGAFLTGVFARDNNVSSEQAGAK